MSLKKSLVIPFTTLALLAGGVACGGSPSHSAAPQTVAPAAGSHASQPNAAASTATPAPCGDQASAIASQSKNPKALAKAIAQSVTNCLPDSGTSSVSSTSTTVNGVTNNCTTVSTNGQTKTSCNTH